MTSCSHIHVWPLNLPNQWCHFLINNWLYKVISVSYSFFEISEENTFQWYIISDIYPGLSIFWTYQLLVFDPWGAHWCKNFQKFVCVNVAK